MFSGKIYGNLLVLRLVYGKNVLKDQIERWTPLKYILNAMKFHLLQAYSIDSQFFSFLNIKC